MSPHSLVVFAALCFMLQENTEFTDLDIPMDVPIELERRRCCEAFESIYWQEGCGECWCECLDEPFPLEIDFIITETS
jgi:hypothetical protein